MPNITKAVADYVKQKGITLSSICERTNLSKNVIYPCLGENASRKLRVDEYFIICDALDISSDYFYKHNNKAS